MMGSCKVTGEMMVDILSKLPPKSLTRFRRVSKSWNELLKTPGFVFKHLSNATTNKLSSTSFISRRLVPSDTNPEGREETVFTLVSLCNDYSGNVNNVQFVVEDLNIPLFMGLERLGVLDEPDIISHCHGIICLANLTRVILWNPAIREFKLLPRSSLLLPSVDLLTLGFGYDPKSELYKVVNIVPSGEKTYNDGRLIFSPPEAEVYTLGGNLWRKIKIDYLETDTCFFSPGDIPFYFNGNCFWFGYEQPKEYESYLDRLEEKTKDVIVLFDMGDEVFHHILLPDSLYLSPYTFDMRLLMWNESVALFGLHKDGCFESYGLWVIDNFDVAGSWTKHLTFEPLAGIERALVFWRSDEIIMATASGSLISYNLHTEDLTHFPIHSSGAPGFVAFLCINSIVPL